MKLKLPFYLILILLLTACMPRPLQQAPGNQYVAWPTRYQQLVALKQWTIRGAMGMRTEREAWSAQLNWQQGIRHYVLRLMSPLGGTQAQLEGRPGRVVLRTADNKVYHASSVEQLIQQQTGWQLPVSSLAYWVRGIPAPQTPAKKQFDAYQHITRLEQQGWSIQYIRYASVKNMDLPSKILLRNRQMTVKLIISEWVI